MDGFFNQYDTKHWTGRSKPTEKQKLELRLFGSRVVNKECPDFFSWFRTICQKTSSINNALCQISHGFRKRVKMFGVYDVNGYRFRSDKYEENKNDLASRNVGVCVTCYDGDDNPIEYFGIIEDILKISWEGSMELELVLFKCRWFDPTSNGIRCTPNLGLVEVKHCTRLTNFDPFVLASQVTQVYYLAYACQSPALSPWWLVYHVPPRDRLLPIDNNTEALSKDLPTFQEDVLRGIFRVETGNELDNLDPTGVDEITDPKELEVLAKKRKNPSSNEEEELDEEDEEVEDEEEAEEEEEAEDEESEDEDEENEEGEDAATGHISHRCKRQVTQEVSQENSIVSASNNSEYGPVIKKKKGQTSTRLKRPPNGVLIPIEPESDHFFKGDKGIAGQVTAILKYEYPSIIKENKNGVEIKCHAFEWEDYCIVDPPDEQTGEIKESAADHFKHEFWSINTLADDTPAKRVEADRILQNLARKQLKQMMYQSSLEWCKDAEAWESLCKYWCSEEYLKSRGLGKLSRTSSLDDVAQNRGGSRNFISTKEYIEKTFVPEQATTMNTYKCMKVGAKKYKENGSNTSIENLKAKKRLDDYEKGLKSAYPEDWQERDLDPAVLYSTGGGMPHGRLPIGDGAFRKSQVVAAAKRSNIKPANSMSYQDLLRRNTFLEKK
ncbi:hypothetical protein ACQ4PT_061782 [Festuca glaucescens]